jgi:hypothetical protein
MNQYNQNQQQANNQSYPNCLRCNIPMQPIMQMPVRTGGISGFFSDWGEYNEKILVLDTYRCPNCRKLEFFDLDVSLPNK